MIKLTEEALFWREGLKDWVSLPQLPPAVLTRLLLEEQEALLDAEADDHGM